MTKSEKVKILIIFIFILIGILSFIANQTITQASQSYITSNINQLKPVKCGLVLGTSRILNNGKPNDFFDKRIEATCQLFKTGKIKSIIVSGDNSKKDYNEPEDMKTELIKRGIPDSVIYADYAGFRTFDSVIRAKDIFGQNSFIIISQQFHNERAVYIARKNGIKAFGFNAPEVTAYKGLKTKIRELLARDKVFLDILFGTKPRFLGSQIIIR